jgi:hypothetical protein
MARHQFPDQIDSLMTNLEFLKTHHELMNKSSQQQFEEQTKEMMICLKYFVNEMMMSSTKFDTNIIKQIRHDMEESKINSIAKQLFIPYYCLISNNPINKPDVDLID